MVADNLLPLITSRTWSRISLERGATTGSEPVLGARELTVVGMGSGTRVDGRAVKHGSLASAQLVLCCLILDIVRIRFVLTRPW